MYVGTAGKGAAAPVDDSNLRLRIEVETPQRVGQVTHQIVAEGVEPIGSVERQGRDLVAAGVFD
jgi:hypothetical protein